MIFTPEALDKKFKIIESMTIDSIEFELEVIDHIVNELEKNWRSKCDENYKAELVQYKMIKEKLNKRIFDLILFVGERDADSDR